MKMARLWPAATVLDLLATYLIDARTTVSLIVENLADTEWNEAQFDTESLLRDEAEPVSEIHFTPGSPRNVRVGVGYRF